MKKRPTKSSKSSKSKRPIFYALGVLFVAIVVMAIMETGKAKIGKIIVTENDEGDQITPPFVNELRMNTPRPPRPPEPHPRRFPKHNLTSYMSPSVRGKPKITINLSYFELPQATGSRQDWEDLELLEGDKARQGPGEQGQAAEINDETPKEVIEKISLENGFNALLSDRISVNRSVADVRPDG